METVDDLKRIAVEHGATLGTTDLSPFDDVAREMHRRVEDGTSAALGFTYRNVDLACNPERSFPWGTSIVVVAVPYLTIGDGPHDERTVARFADGDRYDRLVPLLEEIACYLGARNFKCEVVYDDSRLVDRALAVRAGVGWWGKSTMVLTPRHGPWILIGSVVTDALLSPTPIMRRTCGTCDACMPACPTGAIVAPGILDARRCLAAIFQSRGDIPVELRRAAGGRIYGCDDCLSSCPPGSRTLRSMNVTDRMLSATEVLAMSDDDLNAAVMHWYVPGRKMRFVRRNAIVALGNTGSAEAVGVLEPYLDHRDDLLQRHARWAIDELERRGQREWHQPPVAESER